MSELDNISENDPVDEMQIHSFDVKDGVMNLKMTSGGEESEAVLLAMSDAMGELLDKHDATNYVEFDLHKRGRPAYSVCVRRFHKPTPHDLRVQAEARVKELEATVSLVESVKTALEWEMQNSEEGARQAAEEDNGHSLHVWQAEKHAYARAVAQLTKALRGES